MHRNDAYALLANSCWDTLSSGYSFNPEWPRLSQTKNLSFHIYMFQYIYFRIVACGPMQGLQNDEQNCVSIGHLSEPSVNCTVFEWCHVLFDSWQTHHSGLPVRSTVAPVRRSRHSQWRSLDATLLFAAPAHHISHSKLLVCCTESTMWLTLHIEYRLDLAQMMLTLLLDDINHIRQFVSSTETASWLTLDVEGWLFPAGVFFTLLFQNVDHVWLFVPGAEAAKLMCGTKLAWILRDEVEGWLFVTELCSTLLATDVHHAKQPVLKTTSPKRLAHWVKDWLRAALLILTSSGLDIDHTKSLVCKATDQCWGAHKVEGGLSSAETLLTELVFEATAMSPRSCSKCYVHVVHWMNAGETLWCNAPLWQHYYRCLQRRVQACREASREAELFPCPTLHISEGNIVMLIGGPRS